MAGSASTLSAFYFSQLSSSLSSNGSFKNYQPSFSSEKRFSFTCFLSKKKRLGLMDQILDYIEGGPKLRKWYGAPDLMSKDGNELEKEETPGSAYTEIMYCVSACVDFVGNNLYTCLTLKIEEEEVRDAVLVTDGDNEIGQMIILSLIVKRIRVKALVKDKRVAMEAFGTYVESMAGDAKDKTFLKKALRDVRALICPNEGFLGNIESWKGIQHVILLSKLSVYRDNTGIQAVMRSNAKKLAEQDENAVKACGVPYTIVRTGLLKNTPGGMQGFSFEEGISGKGSLSKEDAAFICVEALENVPQKGLIFEVVNGTEKVSSWKDCFAALMDRSEE